MKTKPDPEYWTEMADGRPNIFGPEKIAPQGLDGIGHLNYYDRDRMLSFQWDGMLEQHVTVSHGGYGEPVRWTFDVLEVWEMGPAIVSYRQPQGAREACLQFKMLCDLWIEQYEAGHHRS